MKVSKYFSFCIIASVFALGACTTKTEQPTKLTITNQTAEVPGQMAEFIQIKPDSCLVTFNADNTEASIEAEIVTLVQARYVENPALEFEVLDENFKSIGDFATFAAGDTKALTDAFKALRDSEHKLKFSTTAAKHTLTKEQYEAIRNTGRYLKVKKASGMHDLYFTGKIGGKYPVHMTISGDIASGSYYYDKSGSSNPMFVTVTSWNDATGDVTMEEINASGEICGTWQGKITADNFVGTCEITFSGKSYSCILPRYKEEPTPGVFSPAKHSVEGSSIAF